MSADRHPVPDDGDGERSGEQPSSDHGSGDDFLADLARAPERAPPRPRTDRSGEMLGRFRLVERLGRGGMGVVYAAEDPTLGRTVALKLLDEAHLGDPERRRRFVREARSASAVSHPAIATVFEIGETAGETWIAMERVDGRTLRVHLDRERLAFAEVARIGAAIARGLAAAHAAGVVHRDLKPDNVMIRLDGSVKLLDFGLAKLVRAVDAPPSGESETLTVDGHILGTPSYMSPEQALGRAPGPASDVFSLGVCLFEMATRTRPFVGETAMEILASIGRDPAPNVAKRAPRIPRRLARAIARCLEKTPDARGPASDLALELDAIAAAPDQAPRRAPLVAAVAAAAAIVSVVVMGWVGWSEQRGRAGSSAPASGTATAGPVAPIATAEPIATAPSPLVSTEPGPRLPPTALEPGASAAAPSSAGPSGGPSAAPRPRSAPGAPRRARSGAVDPLADQK